MYREREREGVTERESNISITNSYSEPNYELAPKNPASRFCDTADKEKKEQTRQKFRLQNLLESDHDVDERLFFFFLRPNTYTSLFSTINNILFQSYMVA